MAARERIRVEPSVLRWARESAGLEPAAVTKRLGIKPDALSAWESGREMPTISQLRRAAELYGRPLAVLLLPSPVEEQDVPADFRAARRGATHAWSPELRSEFRRALSQREVFLEIQEVSPESVPPVNENLRVGGERDPEHVAAVIRTALQMDSWPSSIWQTPSELLRTAIRAAEELGVLVIQTRRVEPAEMQGFSISDWPYPVVALNGGDAPRRRLFTLLHELCHIAISTSGICDLHEAPNSSHDPADEIERFCNQVAAAILMPRGRLLQDPLVRGHEPTYRWKLHQLHELSKRFGASSEAVLIRLIGLGRASWAVYELRKPELDAEYERIRREREEQQQRSEGGPNYYVVKARTLGRGYIGAVLDAYNNRAISSRDVADYLDVRFDQIPQLASRAS